MDDLTRIPKTDPAGRFYSILEMETFLADAGFASVNFHETILDFSIITARKP